MCVGLHVGCTAAAREAGRRLQAAPEGCAQGDAGGTHARTLTNTVANHTQRLGDTLALAPVCSHPPSVPYASYVSRHSKACTSAA